MVCLGNMYMGTVHKADSDDDDKDDDGDNSNNNNNNILMHGNEQLQDS